MCKHLLWCYSCGCIRNIQTETCENIRREGKCDDHVWTAEDGTGACPHDAFTAFNPYCTVAIVKKPLEEPKAEQTETESPRPISASSEVPTNQRNKTIIEMGLERLASAEQQSKQRVTEEDSIGVRTSEKLTGRPTLQVDTNLSRRSSLDNSLSKRAETPVQVAIQTGRQLLDRIPDSYSRVHTEATTISKTPLRKPSGSLTSQKSRYGAPSFGPQPGHSLVGKQPTTASKANSRASSNASEIKDPADEMPLFLTKDTKQPIPARRATGVSKLQQPKKW